MIRASRSSFTLPPLSTATVRGGQSAALPCGDTEQSLRTVDVVRAFRRMPRTSRDRFPPNTEGPGLQDARLALGEVIAAIATLRQLLDGAQARILRAPLRTVASQPFYA